MVVPARGGLPHLFDTVLVKILGCAMPSTLTKIVLNTYLMTAFLAVLLKTRGCAKECDN